MRYICKIDHVPHEVHSFLFCIFCIIPSWEEVVKQGSGII